MVREYLEFEFKFEPLRGDRYPFSVGGAGGDARGELLLPSNDTPLPGATITFHQACQQLADSQASAWPLQPIGEYLFGLLFQGSVRQAYDLAQGVIQTNDKYLRITLQTGALEAAIAALPWEFLWDPANGPLALQDAAIVRYLALPLLQPTFRTDLPLKVLLSGAAPSPTPDVAREFAGAQEALAPLVERGLIAITAEPQLTPKILQRRLREGFQVWHFVGYGGFGRSGNSRILLVDDDGASYALGASELRIVLNRSGVRLIVLSAGGSANPRDRSSFQSLAAALVYAQTPAVVATQVGMPQEATRAFTGDFYGALAQGLPIDACVTEGRKAVMLATGLERPDWGIPMVYSRATDGLLFELSAPESAPTSSSGITINGAVSGPIITGSTDVTVNIGVPQLVPQFARMLQRERPVAPRPPRPFFGRNTELEALRAALRPGESAWIHGAPGCGLTSLLRAAANLPEATGLPGGVVYLDGEHESAMLDDIIFRLYQIFFVSSAQPSPLLDLERAALRRLAAVFIFDRLRLRHAALLELAELLPAGAVLVAAEPSAPEVSHDVTVGGLSETEAVRLLQFATPQLTSAPTNLLIQICHDLEGLPLPLTLFARTVQVSEDASVQALAARLSLPGDATPLARATRLLLSILPDEQRLLLIALATPDGRGDPPELLAVQIRRSTTETRAALEELAELQLVQADGAAYRITWRSLRTTILNLATIGDKSLSLRI